MGTRGGAVGMEGGGKKGSTIGRKKKKEKKKKREKRKKKGFQFFQTLNTQKFSIISTVSYSKVYANIQKIYHQNGPLVI